jgi:hypothetical protein
MELYCTPKVNTLQLNTAGKSSSDPHGLGTLIPIEFFQQDLFWRSSNTHSHSCCQKVSKHNRSIRRRAIVSLAHHSGTSAYASLLACHLPAPTIECLHRPPYKLTCFSRNFPIRTQSSNLKGVRSQIHTHLSSSDPYTTFSPEWIPTHTEPISVEVRRQTIRIHRNTRPLLRGQQCCLFTLLSASGA